MATKTVSQSELILCIREIDIMLRRMSFTLPSSLYVDDLRQTAILAVIQAYKRYNPARASFITFAKRRAQGAILDELRRYAKSPIRFFEEIKPFELFYEHSFEDDITKKQIKEFIQRYRPRKQAMLNAVLTGAATKAEVARAYNVTSSAVSKLLEALRLDLKQHFRLHQ